MDFGVGSFLFAFLAGVLSTLSPCVLPLIPIIIGAATNQHRLGPLALAGGLTISFAVIGTALASLGSSIGIAQDGFRLFAAIIMGLIGVVLISTHLQERFAVAMSGISGAGNTLLSKVSIDGLFGQFLIGILLGLVWTPCVGPTLGAAITLASQGKDLEKIIFVMLASCSWSGRCLISIHNFTRLCRKCRFGQVKVVAGRALKYIAK